jgi:hypothetical protein
MLLETPAAPRKRESIFCRNRQWVPAFARTTPWDLRSLIISKIAIPSGCRRACLYKTQDSPIARFLCVSLVGWAPVPTRDSGRNNSGTNQYSPRHSRESGNPFFAGADNGSPCVPIGKERSLARERRYAGCSREFRRHAVCLRNGTGLQASVRPARDQHAARPLLLHRFRGDDAVGLAALHNIENSAS